MSSYSWNCEASPFHCGTPSLLLITLELILPLVFQGGLAPLAVSLVRLRYHPSVDGPRGSELQCPSVSAAESNEDGKTKRWLCNLAQNLFPWPQMQNCRRHDEIRVFDSIEWTWQLHHVYNPTIEMLCPQWQSNHPQLFTAGSQRNARGKNIDLFIVGPEGRVDTPWIETWSAWFSLPLMKKIAGYMVHGMA